MVENKRIIKILRNQTKLTRGNLSSHLNKLEAAIKKEFVEKTRERFYVLPKKVETHLSNTGKRCKQILDNF